MVAASEKSHLKEIAHVRIGNNVCDQENDFIVARLKTVKSSLEKILGMPLSDNNIPRIAICASGGGYRAGLSMLGALHGSSMPTHNGTKTESLNLLDIVTYNAAISGNAVVIAGMAYTHMTPLEGINQIKPLISKGLLDNFNMKDFALALKKKRTHNQPISFIDFFGTLLAQRTFNNLGIEYPSLIDVLSYAEHIDPAKSPLPIQASIIGNKNIFPYQWIEFTPFEVGSSFLNTAIPLWAFGRKFNKGVSIDFAPPASLSFCMGLWSAAMCVNPHDFFRIRIAPEFDNQLGACIKNEAKNVFTFAQQISKKIGLTKFVDTASKNNQKKESPFSHYRISPPHAFNWNFGMQDIPLNEHETLIMVDAGFDFNFPLPPLLNDKRKVDIIIMFDASTNRLNELKTAEKYFQTHALDFPHIDNHKINQPCSIHHDTTKPNAPIVIYMPLIKNGGYQNDWNPYNEKFTNIFNFKYTEEQTDLLSGLMQYNMEQSMPMILDTIKQWIATKKATPNLILNP